ncbi:RAMP superfamily CRISPR-associated protein [Thiorhodovibrio frisius]|uniref:Putative RAMP superfamily protein probably involved in DNA repair n=1 Tax=Thiorhodovibrio frisius TaxID=631362 RepID=H8YVU0_9GAMM|nr:RAMP superfamily CRISPR-associated protein [Thiorhodovibrio frisius]EIC24030.1 putative RAMP superfamily protein probably involved in DNA repair [Thiorhodovibrio frisius]WPL23104.1 CRISPR-associated RAMP protein, family [Thiorhodovibrio frisius]
MIPAWPLVACARVTLELVTPLSIASGAFDPLYDQPLAQDANGLPTIPGTTLAGVLKAALPPTMRVMLGDWEKSSRLTLSAARIHNADDRPLDGLCLNSRAYQQDAILAPLLAAPPLRQQVRLTEYGTAADTGKFDRCIVPGGHRFTFELCLWGEDAAEQRTAWEGIRQQWLEQPPRLGGGTRNGLGLVRVVRWREGTFDLRDPEAYQRWRALPRRLDGDPAAFVAFPAGDASPAARTLVLPLRPLGVWRIGDGTRPLGEPAREPQRLPLTEDWVRWSIDATGCTRGVLEQAVVIPGAGIKGALRHRTLFHLCRLQGWFAGPDDASQQQAEPLMHSLFGSAVTTPDAVGQAGRLFFADLCLPVHAVSPKVVPHNSIDRFTQGGRQGRLFSEQVLYAGATWPLRIGLGDLTTVADPLRRALRLALHDLATGQLAVGAGAAKGQGFLEAAEPLDWTAIDAQLQLDAVEDIAA